MHIKFTHEDDDGVETEYEVPAKYEVCPRCEGHGTHLNPSIGEHAYTREEFEEEFWDEEDREQYFKRGGIYDVTCHECEGEKVVLVPNFDAIWGFKEGIASDTLKEMYNERCNLEAQWDAERRAELRYGY